MTRWAAWGVPRGPSALNPHLRGLVQLQLGKETRGAFSVEDRVTPHPGFPHDVRRTARAPLLHSAGQQGPRQRVEDRDLRAANAGPDDLRIMRGCADHDPSRRSLPLRKGWREDQAHGDQEPDKTLHTSHIASHSSPPKGP